jgi:hypothetical protein
MDNRNRLGWYKLDDVLAYLQSAKTTERKLRLFAVACCRHIWEQLSDERSRRAVEVTERYADEVALPAEIEAARIAAEAAESEAGTAWAWARAARLAVPRTGSPAGAAARLVAEVMIQGNWSPPQETLEESMQGVSSRARDVGALFGDVFGPLPFRSVVISPAVLAWNNGCVEKLAKGIYHEQDFSSARMGILADALEEAGVTDAEVLGHCRQQGAVHVRGCWLIDCLLTRG